MGNVKLQVNRSKAGYSVTGACVDVDYTVLGPVENNVFVVSDGSSTIVVDPAANVDRIMALVGNRKVDAIFVTHHHNDHMGALRALKEKTGAPVYAPAIDTPKIENLDRDYPPADPCKVDVKVKDKDVVTIGSMVWKVISTPGHTPGSVCFFLSSEDGARIEGANVLVSGDTLFCGSIGRTDFEGGDDRAMRASLRRLSHLPDETLVLPGHNSLTTIADEQHRVFAYFC